MILFIKIFMLILPSKKIKEIIVEVNNKLYDNYKTNLIKCDKYLELV